MQEDRSNSDHEQEIVYRELDTTRESPTTEIVEIVTELEGKDHTELESIWGCIDSVLDEVYSNPPSPEAQIQVAFNYEGYRITVNQDGSATMDPRE